jgi:hypothetical protein
VRRGYNVVRLVAVVSNVLLINLVFPVLQLRETEVAQRDEPS